MTQTLKTPEFKVVSLFEPAGDQPKAVAQLAEGITRGDRFQTLLGITGSGKSATIAWTIEATQKPTLILAPNKSLAAQLTQEMREFFPHNRVEYFVSYYDYYQPEAYIASSDTYIEKDSSINDEIDRLRHSATAALLTRRDTIVVASVSCIYGMGDPAEYRGQLLEFVGRFDRDVAHDAIGLIRKDTISHEYFWLDRWYSIFRFHGPDGALRNYYCNINMPPTFSDGVLDYVDLDIDIVVWPDFANHELDRDDFERNTLKFGYTDDMLSRVEDNLAYLIKHIEGRDFPFDRTEIPDDLIGT